MRRQALLFVLLCTLALATVPLKAGLAEDARAAAEWLTAHPDPQRLTVREWRAYSYSQRVELMQGTALGFFAVRMIIHGDEGQNATLQQCIARVDLLDGWNHTPEEYAAKAANIGRLYPEINDSNGACLLAVEAEFARDAKQEARCAALLSSARRYTRQIKTGSAFSAQDRLDYWTDLKRHHQLLAYLRGFLQGIALSHAEWKSGWHTSISRLTPLMVERAIQQQLPLADNATPWAVVYYRALAALDTPNVLPSPPAPTGTVTAAEWQAYAPIEQLNFMSAFSMGQLTAQALLMIKLPADPLHPVATFNKSRVYLLRGWDRPSADYITQITEAFQQSATKGSTIPELFLQAEVRFAQQAKQQERSAMLAASAPLLHGRFQQEFTREPRLAGALSSDTWQGLGSLSTAYTRGFLTGIAVERALMERDQPLNPAELDDDLLENTLQQRLDASPATTPWITVYLQTCTELLKKPGKK
ncbi:MAG: hypothetical protein ACYDBB_23120 [Armatimonadota bacterium]